MTETERQDAATADWSLGRWQAMKALEYAKTCYNLTNLAEPSACKLYTTPAINITTNNKDPCPFQERVCASPHGITIDTGLIDSNTHLGFNMKPSSRLQFRKVLKCVPIMAEERYCSGWEAQNPLDPPILPGDAHRYYYFGTRMIDDQPLNFTWVLSNYTLWAKPPSYRLLYVWTSPSVIFCQ